MYTILFDDGKLSSQWKVIYEGDDYDTACKKFRRKRLKPGQRVRALTNDRYVNQRAGIIGP